MESKYRWNGSRRNKKTFRLSSGLSDIEICQPKLSQLFDDTLHEIKLTQNFIISWTLQQQYKWPDPSTGTLVLSQATNERSNNKPKTVETVGFSWSSWSTCNIVRKWIKAMVIGIGNNNFSLQLFTKWKPKLASFLNICSTIFPIFSSSLTNIGKSQNTEKMKNEWKLIPWLWLWLIHLNAFIFI